jgi:hypothetical protein
VSTRNTGEKRLAVDLSQLTDQLRIPRPLKEVVRRVRKEVVVKRVQIEAVTPKLLTSTTTDNGWDTILVVTIHTIISTIPGSTDTFLGLSAAVTFGT